MTALLELRDLRVRREARTVLQIDALTVEQAEVLAVIGPNGAGKSTLLLTIARLIEPGGGALFFRGASSVSISDLDFRRRIGLVLQEPLLLDTTVFANVAAGLRFRRLPTTEVKRRVAEWLRRLEIEHLCDRPARALSGGEAQRVSLARAFALQPQLLLLDEPFSALDAPSRARLLADLQSLLAQTQVTTIFITHDLDEALLLGDRVAVLLDGRLRQVGSPQEVFAAPADAEVAAFVGVETIIPGRVVAAQEGQAIVEAAGLRLEAVGDLAVGRAVLFCLRAEDVTLWNEPALPPYQGRGDSSSARNRLRGRVRGMSAQGALVRVEVDCGFPLMALITRASAREMGLTEGAPVTAAFKASAVHLIPR